MIRHGLYPELFLQEGLVHQHRRWLITRHPTMPVIRSRQHKVTYIQFPGFFQRVSCYCLLYLYFPSLGSQEVVFASSDIRLRQTDLKVKKKGKKSSNSADSAKLKKKDIQGYDSIPKPLVKIDRREAETDGSFATDTSAELQDIVKTFDELIDEDFDYTKIGKCSVSPGNVIDYMTFAQ